MIRDRDRENSWLLGDSGGFQIGKGVDESMVLAAIALQTI